MAYLNIEFKAKVPLISDCETKLLSLNPIYIGEDHQVDTYFKAGNGRLKIREGDIENALIHYKREDKAGPKESHVSLYPLSPGDPIKSILENSIGIKAVVDKTRRIYFIGNVKFHFDEVRDLGSFIEVEAIDKDGSIGPEKLKQQCDYYAELFEIRNENFLESSYSDMLENI